MAFGSVANVFLLLYLIQQQQQKVNKQKKQKIKWISEESSRTHQQNNGECELSFMIIYFLRLHNFFCSCTILNNK